MDYNLMNDEDIIRSLAEQVEKLRISRHMKETEIESIAGISRKTFYNFRQGSTGTSLKNFIRLLRALGEVERLQWMFPEPEDYSPRGKKERELPKRVRDRQTPDSDFLWGDEK